MTSYPDVPPATVVTTATNDASVNGGGIQSGAPRASPEVTDIDPTASPKRPTGGLLRVPSVSNGCSESTGGNEVSCDAMLKSLRLTEYKSANELKEGFFYLCLSLYIVRKINRITDALATVNIWVPQN